MNTKGLQVALMHEQNEAPLFEIQAVLLVYPLALRNGTVINSTEELRAYATKQDLYIEVMYIENEY